MDIQYAQAMRCYTGLRSAYTIKNCLEAQSLWQRYAVAYLHKHAPGVIELLD